MLLCSFCSTPNREGELYCEECGNPLAGSTSISTKKLGRVGSTSAFGNHLWSGKSFRATTTVLVRLANLTEPIILENKAKLLLGRHDHQTGVFPDIDLTPYGAVDHGVSRLHAEIHRSEDALTVIDLDSVNGTYLNGQRLIPSQPRVLQDGDEVRFGKLAIHVYFQ